ncbi:MAG: hypothetical protein JO040_00190, partial [Gemmatimonadetes bacterium]|nr:hypothetical protein [Gemmatimonadota bacterium]
MTSPRATEAGTGMLRGDIRVIKEIATQPESKLVKEGATIDGQYYPIPPWEPELAALWAVKASFSLGLTPDEEKTLQAALDELDSEKADFLEGVAIGAVQGAKAVVDGYVHGLVEAVEGMMTFYNLAADPEIWVRVWAVWSAPQGST